MEHIMRYDAENKVYRSDPLFVREGGHQDEIVIDEATYEAQIETYVADGMPRDEAVATCRKPDVWEQILLLQSER